MIAATEVFSNESVGPSVKLVVLTLVLAGIVGVLLAWAWKHR